MKFKMKLRLLISLLFVIGTTITALHELEHINGEHDSSTCKVCTVDNHSVSADIIKDESSDIKTISFDVIAFENQIQDFHIKKTANHSNAPPKIS